MKAKKGHLVIIGGGEDREDDKSVLTRLVELAGDEKARIVVLTTASRLAAEDRAAADEVAATYERAFKDCGAAHVETLHIFDRHRANDTEVAKAIRTSTCVFMAGGDQARLVAILGGTAACRAMREIYLQRGGCISGTSAGASAMSEHMVIGGSSRMTPRKGELALGPGLGFVQDVLIDQHFSQRHRLGRLLSVIAQSPLLVGVGIDEDTALIVTPDERLEVVGSGTVTILDGRDMDNSAFAEAHDGEKMALTDVRLHLLPAGFSFDLAGRTEDAERLKPSKAQPDAPSLSISFLGAVETIVSGH